MSEYLRHHIFHEVISDAVSASLREFQAKALLVLVKLHYFLLEFCFVILYMIFLFVFFLFFALFVYSAVLSSKLVLLCCFLGGEVSSHLRQIFARNIFDVKSDSTDSRFINLKCFLELLTC